jgi:hypothetical protein
MQLQPAVKKFLLGLSALGAIAVISMAQAPVTITPGTSQCTQQPDQRRRRVSRSLAIRPVAGMTSLPATPLCHRLETGRLLITGCDSPAQVRPDAGVVEWVPLTRRRIWRSRA